MVFSLSASSRSMRSRFGWSRSRLRYSASSSSSEKSSCKMSPKAVRRIQSGIACSEEGQIKRFKVITSVNRQAREESPASCKIWFIPNWRQSWSPTCTGSESVRRSRCGQLISDQTAASSKIILWHGWVPPLTKTDLSLTPCDDTHKFPGVPDVITNQIRNGNTCKQKSCLPHLARFRNRNRKRTSGLGGAREHRTGVGGSSYEQA